ncbi:NIPSNAP family protein [Mucilaginibacter xinganensis]|uniref:NIPSNAP family containing protein n=1 Tax=Mucilaginibacter xinganensis TaxID=1234841 RepID=A0A223P3K5_9SPHI|nr:NIPSNAP family protein [Mucilaginibacter xinganensis]ASU36554.1 NIPSNAP family containing protein [Mucilaginibacter xinganensis]
MKRRSFVKSSIIGGAAAAALPALSTANAMNNPVTETEYYELRVYNLKDDAQQKLVETYLKDAAIPALNRQGVKHVGVFTEMKPTGQTKIFTLTAYNSLDHFSKATDGLEKDAQFKARGAAYLNAPATQPAYERIESSLLKAFKHFPALTAPQKKTRIFELRQYQSASEAAGKKKIEMFNDQGEIDIFKRLGFNPVFWGETIIGAQRPNLTYMITFDDLAAKESHWKDFVNDTQWHEISAVPDYADALLVNKITSTMLVPADFSQI